MAGVFIDKGLFRGMTTDPEIVLEVSVDGREWPEVEWRGSRELIRDVRGVNDMGMLRFDHPRGWLPMRAVTGPSTALAVMAVIGLTVASEATAQARPMGGFLQAGVVRGSGEFAGIGASATFEISVYRTLRGFIHWGDWNLLGSCTVTDAESTCSEEAESWEAGLRLGFGESSRVAPFAGAGVGVYRLRSSLYDASSAATVSATVGMDIMISRPVVLRLSASYQEVLGQAVRDRIGESLRFMGLHAGLGLAVW